MNAVEPGHAGLASGINNAVSRTSGVVALAVFGVIVAMAFGRDLEQRLSTLQLPSQAQTAVLAQVSRLAAIESPAGIDAASATALRDAINASFVSGFRLAMLIAAGLALAASVCAALTIRGEPPP